jgi:hypothetical protein
MQLYGPTGGSLGEKLHSTLFCGPTAGGQGAAIMAAVAGSQ